MPARKDPNDIKQIKSFLSKKQAYENFLGFYQKTKFFFITRSQKCENEPRD